jgi:hypothetical protein
MNRQLRDLLYPFLRIRSRLRARRFDHVVTLGYNCELAARFFQNFKFVDSTLFSWASSIEPGRMAHAIEHSEDIFSGEVEAPTRTFPLFRCRNTDVRAHGRASMKVWTDGEPTPEFVEKERSELVSRFRHLREKTLAYLKDEKSVLTILKTRTVDCAPGEANENVLKFVRALRNIGARNVTFLAICEEKCAGNFASPHPEFELRTVAEYNPESNAVNLKLGDSRGWRLIFEEFRPKTLKKQAHKFKFEDEDGH